MMGFDGRMVGEVIREMREEKGLSQEVVSGLASIGRSHLGMIETGKKKANVETLWKLAGALDVRPSELVRRVERKVEEMEGEG